MGFHFAKLAARLLAAVPRGVGKAPPPPTAERDLGILALRQALRARGRHNRRRSVFAVSGTVIAAAAAVVLIIAFRGDDQTTASWWRRPTPLSEPAQSIRAWGARVVASTGNGQQGQLQKDLPDGETVHAGQALTAWRPDGARLSLSSGTVLQLAPQTRIDVQTLESAQRFRIPTGRLHADVAPLDVGQRFVIETPDSEIEVHGTVFELAVVAPQPGCSGGTRTRVAVSRGVVEVRSAGRDDYVAAGQHWPPECEPLANLSAGPARRGEDEASSPPMGEPARTVTARSIRRTIPGPAAAAATTPSELVAQNDLFAAAMAANGRGQVTRALQDLDRLVARFPRGQLAEAAYAERMRLRHRSGDPVSARRGAREYLDSFPKGFAAGEARLILGSTPEAP